MILIMAETHGGIGGIGPLMSDGKLLSGTGPVGGMTPPSCWTFVPVPVFDEICAGLPGAIPVTMPAC